MGGKEAEEQNPAGHRDSGRISSSQDWGELEGTFAKGLKITEESLREDNGPASMR